jgi:hypothetical protein
MKQAVKAPSPLFYGFFLAAEWKEKEVFRPFAELLRWPEAMLPNLLSEAVVSEDVASRLLPEFYDGDPPLCSGFSSIRTRVTPLASGNGEP